jgi:hypothetical protein
VALALLQFPAVSADDTPTSARGLTDGVSSSGYVCDPDGCSPNDKKDYWKIQGKMGDIIQVTFSGSMSNPAWWLPGDGWEGTFTMGSISQNVDDGSPTSTLSTTLSTSGEVILKVEGKDSWGNDGFDYTLTPSIDKTNRDSDEDGFVDTEDDCTYLVGSSTNDRKGARILTEMDGLTPTQDGAFKTAQMPLQVNPHNGWIRTTMATATTSKDTKATIVNSAVDIPHSIDSAALIPTETATQILIPEG